MLKKAKTCERCKASECQQGWGYHCTLGYSVNATMGTPNEPCPKPLSYKAFFEQRIRNPTGKSGGLREEF